MGNKGIILLLALTCASTALAASDGTRRGLLQAGVSCASEIPACEANFCRFVVLNGGRKAQCDKCKNGYVTSRNRLQCICRAGTYETCTTGDNCECTACDTAFFCPGGNRTAANLASQAERGQRFSCHKANVNPTADTASVNALGLTTATQSARGHTECRTMPGYYLKSNARATQQAALCSNATYSPGDNRLLSCRKCPTGTEALATLTDASLRTSVADTCRVPAGRFWSLTYAKKCPRGTYRSGQALTTEASASTCLACPRGFTTAGMQTTQKSDCTYGMPGYELSYAKLTAGDGSEPDLCSFGLYYKGGPITSTTTSTCVTCPYNSTTSETGAIDETECVVPPGWYVDVSNSALAKCPTSLAKNGITQGYYRAGWVSVSSPSVLDSAGDGSSACTACGVGILSEHRLTNDRYGSDNPIENIYAATNVQCCYYLAGQGLTQDFAGPGKLMAADCPANMYSHAGEGRPSVDNKIYLVDKPTVAPCTPCPTNLVSPVTSTSIDNCTNVAGYSYDTVFGSGQVLSSQCLAGYYNPAASLAPCFSCPTGRTTTRDTTPGDHQASINNCFVMPGYGLYFSGSVTPWIKPGDVTVTSTTIPSASVKVFECEQGYYGEGGSVSDINSYCTACPVGSTTSGKGKTSLADCNVCAAGSGYKAGTTECETCPLGTYNDVNGFQASCTACGDTTYTYYYGAIKEQDIVSSGTTLRSGSTAPYECVAKSTQLDPDVGQTMALGALGGHTSSGLTMQQCINTCDAGKCCIAELQYVASGTGNCWYLNLDPVATDANPTTGFQLYYNIPASNDALNSRKLMTDVQSKSITPSGYYARCEIPAAAVPTDWETVIADPNIDAGKPVADPTHQQVQTNVSPLRCQEMCNTISNCWGFFFQPVASATDGKCLLRAGAPAADKRSFFTLP